MRAAIIESGKVANVILADDPSEFDAVPIGDEVGIWWGYDGEAFTSPVQPEPVPEPARPVEPRLFASIGVVINDGAIATVEMAAQLQGAIYDQGWLMVMFAEQQDAANYLVFAQVDVPARIEQFKDGGAFELVFSDVNGDPVEPTRIDIQILKVR